MTPANIAADTVNRRWVLARRPVGMPHVDDFRLEHAPLPQPGPGELLVRNVYVGVDPGMRMQLADVDVDDPGFKPWPLGATVGFATVGVVVASRVPGFESGEWVSGILQWQDYAVVPAAQAWRVADRRLSPSAAIGVLGIPGLSAYFGLLELGRAQAGETIVVTSAAGAVGSVAGQIARLRGCRVVGVAGGDEKCRWLRDTLGFDAAIDRQAQPDVAAAIKQACPEGVDVLFDNVGNAMVDALLPLMRTHGRVVVCGQVADYGKRPSEIPGLHNTNRLITQRLTMRGLYVFDFADRFDAAREELAEWVAQGRLQWREELQQGIERLPAAFTDLLAGRGYGRKVVQIAPLNLSGEIA